MTHITKTFPGVRALDDVSFNLKSGEVLALLGENGAGKSTLMKVLSGVYTRDGGEIMAFGNKVEKMTPKRAKELGIAIIHQELNLCSHLSVAENIFLGQEIVKGGVVQRKQMNDEARAILKRLSLEIEPETLVGSLSVSKQQMIEIAKALLHKARVLIMDEPTSALTAKEINELFRIIRQLRDEGCGIVYISHRLEELQHIVDRVTIMRDGQYITSMNFKDTTLDTIISYMVGRDIKDGCRPYRNDTCDFRCGSEGKRRDSGGWKDHKDSWAARCHPRRRGPGAGRPKERWTLHKAFGA